MARTKDIRSEVLSILTTIAPEVDPADIRGHVSLREQVDLDSMDWLNFLVGIHKQLHIAVPEKDYASIRTLDELVRYLDERVA
ncbi:MULTISPECIES: acyl carrier protein [Mycolicibacterium]|uniref:phosphopantetheine-binding protein n=1 Tax=Mycolicibacterium TaxID=1866885 RepID=UPI00148F5AC2|nr:acyl carrier protein [Mycolicibacterium fortuitum]